MKKIIKSLSGLLLAGTLVMAAGTGSTLSQTFGQCLDNRAINLARANGIILPYPDILRLAGVKRNEAKGVRVCNINGQPFYLIRVLRNNGVAQNLILRASDGTPYIAG